jgi:hypothetical protein
MCKAGDYKTVIQTLSLGFSANPTNLESDCYMSSTSLATQVESLNYSVKNFKVDDWLAPVYKF